ncbi:MAG: 2OG-Fe(II) oxygenase [Candidatus Thiothrix moscowensis]|nr:2OG-Fe(II) oxygenase [Candidatus Thiothrix moscowensis]
MSAFDQEWQAWLDQNLLRGCNVGELYKIMRENGFDVGSIRQMMGAAYPVGIELEETASGVDYLSLAGTLEVHGQAAGVKRFDTNLLQLYLIDDFLTPEECDKVVALTEAKLRPSKVTHDSGDKLYRTSSTCHLDENLDPFVRHVDEKIARTLGIRLPYSEPIQAQHYAIGQEFKAHHDYFVPNTDIYQQFAEDLGQRTWTFMVYLNDTLKGGGTHFLHIDQIFYPKKGQAVIWNNLLPDGTPNRHTLHHGMPVEAGKKVIITKWFREKGHGEMFYAEEGLAV